MQNSPKNLYKKLLGMNGEKKAEKFLKKKGYRIIERNFVTHYGEADLIVSMPDLIVFVEVKTRTNKKFGMPSSAVDYNKQKRYRRIAEYYLYHTRITDISVRFDVIEILNGEINHIEDAFQ